MKTISPFVLTAVLTSLVLAQDTLNVMTWNLLNYRSANASRDVYYRTVIRHVKPDVLVVQEITSQSAVDSFYSRVVNVVFPDQFSKSSFIDGPDSDNELYFKPSRCSFISNIPIRTALRNISQFTMFNSVASDTFRIYSAHLKASNTTSDQAKRAAEVDSLRRATNSLPTGKHCIVVGDFNIYSSNESAYQKLLQDNPTDDGHFVDELALTGTWNNAAYAQHHTQSTRTRQLADSGATGGLDDRFDMILFSRATSQSGTIQYRNGSLTPVGNDGNHYNDSINRQPNNAVPDSVATALYYASDHLPVSARFVFTPGTVTREYPVNVGWNLVSVPLNVHDYRTVVVFSSSSSSAFAFYQATGYVAQDTLDHGVGYWLKFPSTQNVSMSGSVRLRDTVHLSAGWNVVGSISNPILRDSIIQIPAGIVVSPYYRYAGGYAVADTITPGKGYWVKASQGGVLIFR